MITKNLIKISFIFLSLLLLLLLSSCGSVEKLKSIHKPVDLRTSPLDPDKRVQRNLEEGRGISLKNMGKRGSTTYEFSTSNPMWRASLETLDFLPLSTVDYSGGIIITDWVSTENENENESYKITIKFLSNEIRADGLDIIIHQKLCKTVLSCKIEKLETSVSNDLKLKILKRATLYAKNDVKKLKEKYGEYRVLP